MTIISGRDLFQRPDKNFNGERALTPRIRQIFPLSRPPCRLGYSVALSADGTRLAVGANKGDGVNGIDSGHVRVFEYSGTDWAQLGGDVDGEAAGDRSGWSVALSADGTRLAVGAIFNGGNGINSGHARVFDYNGAAWTQIGEDIDGEDASDQSGASVALSADGTRLAVGAYVNGGVNGDFSGHARVYDVCSTNEPTPTPTMSTTTLS